MLKWSPATRTVNGRHVVNEVAVVRLNDGRTVSASPQEPFFCEVGDVARVTAELQAISGTVDAPRAYQ